MKKNFNLIKEKGKQIRKKSTKEEARKDFKRRNNRMKYDISALGNALVDTQYMVDHDFLDEIGLEADSMTLASAEEHSPIIDKLESMGVESVSDCGGSATNSLVAASYYGSKCHHVCRVANDEDGKNILKVFKKLEFSILVTAKKILRCLLENV